MRLLLGLLLVVQMMAIDRLARAEEADAAPPEQVLPDEAAAPKVEGGNDDEFVDVFDLHEKRLQEEAQRAQKEAEQQEALAAEQQKREAQKFKAKTPMLRIAGSVAVALGGAALVAGAATGALALDADDKVKKNCPEGDCAPEYHGDLERRNTLALSTDILLGVGGGVAVAGALMVIFSYDWARPGASRDLSIRPAIGPTLVGAVMDWRF